MFELHHFIYFIVYFIYFIVYFIIFLTSYVDSTSLLNQEETIFLIYGWHLNAGNMLVFSFVFRFLDFVWVWNTYRRTLKASHHLFMLLKYLYFFSLDKINKNERKYCKNKSVLAFLNLDYTRESVLSKNSFFMVLVKLWDHGDALEMLDMYNVLYFYVNSNMHVFISNTWTSKEYRPFPWPY